MNSNRARASAGVEPSHLGEMGMAVVASTDSIVSSALARNWLVVLDQCDQRRQLLAQIELSTPAERTESSMAALQAAVYESELAVARMVAHAMICKQIGNENIYPTRN